MKNNRDRCLGCLSGRYTALYYCYLKVMYILFLRALSQKTVAGCRGSLQMSLGTCSEDVMDPECANILFVNL